MKVLALATLILACNFGFIDAFGKKCKTPSELVLRGDGEHQPRVSSAAGKHDPSSEAVLKKKSTWRKPGKVPENLKVAIYGDLGVKKKSKKVLKMLRDWGVQGLILTGDYDYIDKPKKLMRMFDSILDENVPIFATIGNHDILDWSTKNGYMRYFINRLKRIGVSRNCIGEFGVNAICGWNGLNIVLSGVGTRGYAHTDFVEDTLSLSKSSWKICAWHKCQRMMQIGKKKNQTGYDIYDMCRKFGAIVATSHVHAYSRSKLMTNYKKQQYLNQTDVLNIHVKTSVNIVSGMGGYSIDKSIDGLRENPWWAATVSRQDESGPGAVLCTFHIDGNPEKAFCEFRDISGKVWDSWTMYSHIIKEPRPPRSTGDGVANPLANTTSTASVLDKQGSEFELNDSLYKNQNQFVFGNRSGKMNGPVSGINDADSGSDKITKISGSDDRLDTTSTTAIKENNSKSFLKYEETTNGMKDMAASVLETGDKSHAFNNDKLNKDQMGVFRSRTEPSKSDFNEFPVDSDFDIAVGSVEQGFDGNCGLKFVPTLKHDIFPERDLTPLIALRFANIQVIKNKTISGSHLQILRTSQTALNSDNYLYNFHDTFNTDFDKFVSGINTRNYFALNKNTNKYLSELKNVELEIRSVHYKSFRMTSKGHQEPNGSGSEKNNGGYSTKIIAQDKQNLDGFFSDDTPFCQQMSKSVRDIKSIMNVPAIKWKFDALDHETIHVSPNLSAGINSIINSENWQYGDSVVLFISPAKAHIANTFSSFVFYGHGINNGCYSPTLDIQQY
ncbi:hypothetical protein AYI69_g6519 [Smittium culicis]|uniref:Calcineurin-like phosphoesterase domain-containing protein n=1 Tax=Smittium culicis TaxID=133412 RepID=A0A1R1XYE4_9FUNG|nr:hypothetical protein AYI69_g6519 [Smittium culicis]